MTNVAHGVASPVLMDHPLDSADPRSEASRRSALCIGSHGPGRWQEVEDHAADQRFHRDKKLDEESAPARTEARVIPMLLPGASENRVPLFARPLHRVDLRASGDAKHRAAMRELVQTILGTSGRFAGAFP